jgi:hypothetical protein
VHPNVYTLKGRANKFFLANMFEVVATSWNQVYLPYDIHGSKIASRMDLFGIKQELCVEDSGVPGESVIIQHTKLETHHSG